jgi:hypothetical protein
VKDKELRKQRSMGDKSIEGTKNKGEDNLLVVKKRERWNGKKGEYRNKVRFGNKYKGKIGITLTVVNNF